MRSMLVRHESWPLRGVFAISRGARRTAEVVVAEVRDGVHTGRGECVPYPRYGESIGGVMALLERQLDAVRDGLDRATLQTRLPPGAARNALDCALWDLEAKASGRRVWELAGLDAPPPALTAYTISLGTPEAMADAARAAHQYPLLKLKLGGEGDVERVAAVREAVADARIIVDANEAWPVDHLGDLLSAMARFGVELVEQPLPADADAALADVPHEVPVCADESCHMAAHVAALVDRYDVVNVKLDKAGGLTEALRLVDAARAHGLGLLVGTMMGTSLLMAPAMLLTPAAQWVDLDGSLWVAEDRPHGLWWVDGRLQPPQPALWG